jgi:hypothetical protein
LRQVKEQSAHIVATTFHISQGGEISKFIQDDDSLVVKIRIDRTAKGAIWLALPSKPNRLYLDNVSLDQTSIRTVAPGIYAVSFLLCSHGELRLSWG